MSRVEQHDRSLAEAVTVLVGAIHQAFPVVSISPVPPYDDEDFALAVRIPAGMDREEVMNTCIHHALKVEDEFGFTILTRVKEAAAEKAVS